MAPVLVGGRGGCCSRRITGQSGRPPAAWAANKCHHNVAHRGRKAQQGVGGWMGGGQQQGRGCEWMRDGRRLGAALPWGVMRRDGNKDEGKGRLRREGGGEGLGMVLVIVMIVAIVIIVIMIPVLFLQCCVVLIKAHCARCSVSNSGLQDIFGLKHNCIWLLRKICNPHSSWSQWYHTAAHVPLVRQSIRYHSITTYNATTPTLLCLCLRHINHRPDVC